MERLVTQLGQSRVILYFIVLIGIIVGYLTYSGADPLSLTEETIIRRDDLESFSNFAIDFSILEDERYRSLEIFGESPVGLGITGERRDPFAPI